ncbi:MAG: LamG domain-containing protein [Phycisphaerae bacterium]|nr:LamG domain-containing protein [Phycisphaerae bacterium]
MSNDGRFINRSLQLLMVVLGCLLAGANGAAADLNDGLVGYWSFDEGSGDTVYDGSGAGHNGQVYGAVWVNGVSETALQLDGDEDYVDIAALDFPGAFTVSVWVRASSLNGTQYARQVFNSTGAPAEGDNVVIQHQETDKWLARIWDRSADESVCIIEGTEVIPGQWYHLAYTCDSSSGVAKLVVDAQMRGSGTWAGLLVGSNSTPQIGRHLTAPRFFHGAIDEVRIYDRALDEDEIRQLYEWTSRPDPQDDNTDGDQSDVSGTSSDPVNTATGSFFHQETDLSIPSRGSPLTFTRFYNSKAAAPGRKAAKPKQASPGHKLATSQPASKKHGEQARIDAEKPDKSAPGKEQEQAAGSSQAKPNMKEKGK